MARQSLSPMEGVDISKERMPNSPKEGTMTHLKYLRKKNGYTLDDLAKITNISVSYLSRLESGSRRLNTDLIRRLSHAFHCEPSELLQEVSHNKKVITNVDFSKRRGGSLKAFAYGPQGEQVPAKDVPVYCLTVESDDENGYKVTLRKSAPIDWRYRPIELTGRDVFALNCGSHFKPFFNSTAVIYLSNSSQLTPEATVIIAPNDRDIMLKKVWSVTPTIVQLCNFDQMDDLKSGKISSEQLMIIERDSIQELYRVVGFTDFETF